MKFFPKILEQLIRCIRIDSRFIQTYPPGHYYSPIPSWPASNYIGNSKGRLPQSIDLDVSMQLELLEVLKGFYKDIPAEWNLVTGSRLRYRFANEFFSFGDGVVYFCMLHHFRPKQVIEIGCGWSSALLLDVDELFFNKKTEIILIDPDLDRLRRLMRSEDRIRIIEDVAQSQPVSLFEKLNDGDFLFIDSSHVAKYGSDLLYIVFEILPRLRPGVVVHFHDIIWPFEYPDIWFANGRGWNECYFLRAFLQDNLNWRILFFNSFMESEHLSAYSAALPLVVESPINLLTMSNSSLWLVKVG